jgi:alcohol dehydrogenase
LPHGAGLIVISLAYYSFLAHSGACDSRMVDMARALGKTDAKVPMDFVAALSDLQKACNVAEIKLSEYGIKRDQLPGLAKRAREIMGGLFEVDPVSVTQKDVEKILADSYR